MVGLALLVYAGSGDVIVVVGVVVSTTHETVASLVPSTLLALSTACTTSVCLPCDRPVKLAVPVVPLTVTVLPPSRAYWKPATPLPPGSRAVNAKLSLVCWCTPLVAPAGS